MTASQSPERTPPKGMHRCASYEIVIDGKPACSRFVPHRLLMCPQCWRLVAPKTQRNLYLRYRAIDDDGRAHLTEAYLAAVKKCQEDVRTRLGLTPRVLPS